ncbi:hypothetical protein JHK85_024114 [Glycine max]|nr:hypothetical protein JHK85_024114 [Glycine max]
MFTSNEKKVAKKPNNGKRIQQPAINSPKESAQPVQPRPDNNFNKAKATPQTEPKINKEANKDNGNNKQQHCCPNIHLQGIGFYHKELQTGMPNW